jgi:hypothetical protein
VKLVRPVAIDDAALLASSVAESVALWDVGTGYATGNLVRRDTTHRVYESLQDANSGNTPEDEPDWWIDIGPTLRWAMFDQSNATQTVAAGEIAVTINPGGRVDTLAIINAHASELQVIATSAVDGEVFNETYSLISTSGIVDAYTYFTEPIVMVADKVVTGLPSLYGDLTVDVAARYSGVTVRIGALLLGFSRKLGVTEYGLTTGIIDFTRKERDPFGDINLVERGYANRGNFRVWCANAAIEAIQRMLAEYRAVPVLYIGTERFANTFIYGIYRDFSIAVEHLNDSILSIELEGYV